MLEASSTAGINIDRSSSPDLLVAGAGTAGLTLAHAAAEAGASVLLIEKAERLGGTLYLSTGMFAAGGTRRQRARGIEDSPDDHLRDVLRISKGTVNREMVRLYCDLAPGMVDWLEDQGFDFAPSCPSVLYGHEAYERPRIYWGAAGGVSILRLLSRLLEPHLASGRVRVLQGIQLDALLLDRGRAVGVRAGDRGWIAPRIALTTGGYASSPELFARLTNGRRLVSIGSPTSTGDGLRMAEAAGAALVGGQFFLPAFAGIEDVERRPGRVYQRDPDAWDVQACLTPQARPPWEIWVNQEGKRFCDEGDDSVDRRERRLLEQPDMRFWIVLDEAILREAPPLVPAWPAEVFRGLAEEGRLVKRGGTVDELAARIEVPASALRATIDEYNRAQATAEQDPLGRRHRPRPIAEGPFYAVRQQGIVVRTWAGVRVNRELEVLRADGSPIENLYALGEAIGGGVFSGDAFVAGMSIGPALALARYLGGRLASRAEPPGPRGRGGESPSSFER